MLDIETYPGEGREDSESEFLSGSRSRPVSPPAVTGHDGWASSFWLGDLDDSQEPEEVIN